MLRIIASTLLISTLFLVSVSYGQKCPDFWEIHGVDCYKVLGLQSSWVEAKEYCRIFGGDLLRIDDAEEEKLVEGIIRRFHGQLKSERYWIDGTDILHENDFRWIFEHGHTENITYTHWRPGQPDNYQGNENCMELQYDDMSWNDEDCDFLRSFICETDVTEGSIQIIG